MQKNKPLFYVPFFNIDRVLCRFELNLETEFINDFLAQVFANRNSGCGGR